MERVVELGPAVREAACPLCHGAGEVARTDPRCDLCGVGVHRACADEMPGCPTLGCARARPDRRTTASRSRAPMRRGPLFAGREAFHLDVADTLAFTAFFAGLWVLLVAAQFALVVTGAVAVAMIVGGASAAYEISRARSLRAPRSARRASRRPR